MHLEGMNIVAYAFDVDDEHRDEHGSRLTVDDQAESSKRGSHRVSRIVEGQVSARNDSRTAGKRGGAKRRDN